MVHVISDSLYSHVLILCRYSLLTTHPVSVRLHMSLLTGSRRSHFYADPHKSPCRSDIHENMNCARCNTNDQVVGDNNGYLDVRSKDSSGGFQANQSADDIGGFAELAGCLHKLKNSERQIGCPLEEDLKNWGHHFISETVPDAMLHASAGDEVTFVFTNQVDGKLVPVESTVKTATSQSNDQIPLKAEFNETTGRSNPRALGIPIVKGSSKFLKTSVNSLHSARMLPTFSQSLFRKSSVSNSSDDDFI